MRKKISSGSLSSILATFLSALLCSEAKTQTLTSSTTSKSAFVLQNEQSHFIGADFIVPGNKIAAIDKMGHLFIFTPSSKDSYHLEQSIQLFTYNSFRPTIAMSVDFFSEQDGTGKVAIGDNQSHVWIYHLSGQLLHDIDLDAFDNSSGNLQKKKFHHSYSISQVRFSADGTHLAVLANGTAKIWQMSNTQKIFPLHIHGKDLSSIALSPDGNQVMTTNNNDIITISDLSGKMRKVIHHRPETLKKGHYPLRSAFFSPDGHKVIVTSTRTFAVYTLKDLKLQYSSEGLTRDGCTYSPTGKTFLCAVTYTTRESGHTEITPNTIEVSNEKNPKDSLILTIENRISEHEKMFMELSNAKFSPDEKRLLALDRHTGKVYVWQLPSP